MLAFVSGCSLGEMLLAELNEELQPERGTAVYDRPNRDCISCFCVVENEERGIRGG